jgi:hypothetical protein
MQCTVCRKRFTAAIEHESQVVLQRMAAREGFNSAEVLHRLNPLCRLCRLVFQQACEAQAAEPADPAQRLAAVLDQVMQTKTGATAQVLRQL